MAILPPGLSITIAAQANEVFNCIVCGAELPDDDVEALTCSEACADKAVAQGLITVEELDEASPRKCPSHPNDEGGACEPMPSEPWRCVYGNHPPDPAKACCGEFGTGSGEHGDDCPNGEAVDG